jgi:hypothetical protein
VLEPWPKFRHNFIGLLWRRIYLNLHVQNCVVCQQAKTTNTLHARLLQPLPIPSQVWEDVAMNFITSLPLSYGCTTIMVVIDRLSKYTHFLPMKMTILVAEAFMHHNVKLNGMPKSIGQSVLQVHFGRIYSSCRVLGWQWVLLITFNLMVKVQPFRQQFVALRKNNKLGMWYLGPFEIIARVRHIAYKLKLPDHAKIRPIFHVSQLKPFKGYHTITTCLCHSLWLILGLLFIQWKCYEAKRSWHEHKKYNTS